MVIIMGSSTALIRKALVHTRAGGSGRHLCSTKWRCVSPLSASLMLKIAYSLLYVRNMQSSHVLYDEHCLSEETACLCSGSFTTFWRQM